MGWFSGRSKNDDSPGWLGSCCLCGAQVTKSGDTVCSWCSEYKLTADGRRRAAEGKAGR
jgi:hypothetical protein